MRQAAADVEVRRSSPDAQPALPLVSAVTLMGTYHFGVAHAQVATTVDATRDIVCVVVAGYACARCRRRLLREELVLETEAERW